MDQYPFHVDEVDLQMASYMEKHIGTYGTSGAISVAALDIIKGLKEKRVPAVMTAYGFTAPAKEIADLFLQCYCILLDNYCFSLFDSEAWADFGGLSFYEAHRRAKKWSKLAYDIPGHSRWNDYQEFEKEDDLN